MAPGDKGQAIVTTVDGPSGMEHAKPLTTMTVAFDRSLPAGIEIGRTVVENITYPPTVVISGNTFSNPAGPVGFVEPTNRSAGPATPVHQNVTVTRNTVVINDVTVDDVKSVAGFRFTENTVRRGDGPDAPPYTSPLFVFTGSSDLRLTGNTYDGGLLHDTSSEVAR